MASSSTNIMAVDVEWLSTNKPHIFDGSNYQFWSNRMSIFMRSYDYEMWDVVLDGPHVPMKTKTGSEDVEPKLWSEWSESKMKKVQVNFKAINSLHYALNPIEFNWISTCKTTKEIWNKLKVTYEGTSQVKK